jgi:hypothetical protein
LSQLKNVVNAERDISLPAYDRWIDIAVKNLLPAVVHKTNPEAILGNNYEFIRSLTHERDVIIDQLSENLRYYVKGPAGSGKTWLAFEQARRWSAMGKKVAIVSYNRGLTSYMHIKNNELADESKVNFVGRTFWFGFVPSNMTRSAQPSNPKRLIVVIMSALNLTSVRAALFTSVRSRNVPNNDVIPKQTLG